jgi:hypothetical protein
MKRRSFLTIVVGCSLLSFSLASPTELAAGDRSGRGADVSAGGVSASAGRSGASVSGGGVSVSADRGGASVSGGGASVSADGGGASVSADRGDASVSGRAGEDSDEHTTVTERSVGDRSYGSLGEWFDDLRSSLFGGRRKGSDDRKTTTTSSSVIHTTQTSESGGTQVNRARVVQKSSSETTNVTRIEQRN